MKQSVFNFAAGAVGVLVNYAFGGWTQALSFLGLLIVIDYITGVTASVVDGTGLSSNRGFKGIMKKVLIFVVVAISHRADILLETDILMTGAVYFYIANELISVIENLGRMNFPLPPQLNQIVAVLKGKSEQK